MTILLEAATEVIEAALVTAAFVVEPIPEADKVNLVVRVDGRTDFEVSPDVGAFQ